MTPAKSIKLTAKCASIIAGRECVLKYRIMKTAPMADVTITWCNPPLQWMNPNATEEIPMMIKGLRV